MASSTMKTSVVLKESVD
jgi:hypothetical protein